MKTQVIERAGKKEFAVIPYRDFLRMQAELEDYRDLQALRRAKADPANRAGRPFEEAAQAMGLLAVQGSPAAGLAVLAKLDRAFAAKRKVAA